MRDHTKLRNIAGYFITECRKARINADFPRFSQLANLITGRKDLNFTNFKESQSFSCTFEMERKLNN
jgi:hypothetical protein